MEIFTKQQLQSPIFNEVDISKIEPKICISTSNEKLGSIPSIEQLTLISCRQDAPCMKKCYANKGRYLFINNRISRISAYMLYKQNPVKYFSDIIEALKPSLENNTRGYFFVRWHSTGEIVDKNYFNGVVRVAEAIPETTFMIFTKKFWIINDFVKNGGLIPDNLKIIFSSWNGLEVPNPYKFPVSYVKEKKNDLQDFPKNAQMCGGSCVGCWKCWKLKHGDNIIFDEH